MWKQEVERKSKTNRLENFQVVKFIECLLSATAWSGFSETFMLHSFVV